MSVTTMDRADALVILTQLDEGELDALPSAVRSTLRAEAERALTREYRVAEVVAVYIHRGNRFVRVACPFCARLRGGKPRTHTHGWPWGDSEPGTRMAHCVTASPGEYRIKAPGVTS